MMPEYMFNWHHIEIIEALEAVERGELKRLAVFMPPRSGKSQTISQLFPTWYLGRNPKKKLIQTGYNQTIVEDFGSFVRNTMRDDEKFQHIFPDIEVADDSKSKKAFGIKRHRGTYFATGVGGALTGRGGDCVVGDTVVYTNEGAKEIKELQDFDGLFALSYNEVKKVQEWKPIKAWRQTKASKPLYKITTEHGVIEVTEDHKFYTSYDGYVDAKNLWVGDILVHSNYDYEPDLTYVLKIEVSNRDVDVFDIQVEDNHNFYANGILVHNCIIIDDPVKNHEDVLSPDLREKAWVWYQSTLYTRLMPNGSIIIVNTRWHHDDLAGRILANDPYGKWTVLSYPAVSGGKALWPAFYDFETLMETKQTIGPYQWAAQYMQDPIIDEGNILKQAWFKYYSSLPDIKYKVWSIDTAVKTGQENDYSVAQLWGMAENGYYLLHQVRGKWEFPDLQAKLIKFFEEMPANEILIEDTVSGQQLVQAFKRFSTFPVIPMTPGRNIPRLKEERLHLAAPLFESGKVYFPEKTEWVFDLKDELVGFPYKKHDDMVDATTMALYRMDKKSRKQRGNVLTLPISAGKSLKYK